MNQSSRLNLPLEAAFIMEDKGLDLDLSLLLCSSHLAFLELFFSTCDVSLSEWKASPVPQQKDSDINFTGARSQAFGFQ